MKRTHGLIYFALLLCMASLASAAPAIVNYAELGIAQGGTAVYDASAGTITWSGGSSGKIGLTDGTFLNFDSGSAGVTITGTLSGASGSGSDITVSDLTFKLSYAPFGQTQTSALVIEGALSGQATYNESLDGIVMGLGAVLSGEALVDVTAYATDGSMGTYSWVDTTGSQLITSMIGVPNFSSYSQDYTTNNLIIKVMAADYVPEPATVTLLACGVLGLMKKRRK